LYSKGELKVSARAREKERIRERMLVSFDGWPPLLFHSLSVFLPISVIQHEGHRIAVQSEHAALLSIAPPVCVT
jgi:hypothetical protein